MKLNECKPIFASSFNNWRELVIELDNYTCQICGKKGESGSLEAHHIIPLAFIGKNEKLYPLGLLIANGMAVHKNCHPEKGMTFGKQVAEDLLRQMLGEKNWEILESIILDYPSEAEEDLYSSENTFEDRSEELNSPAEVLFYYIAGDVEELLEQIQRKYQSIVKRRLLALGLDNIAEWTREQIIEAKACELNTERWQFSADRIKTATRIRKAITKLDI